MKVWNWIKKYWKWLLFPIGLIGFLIGVLAKTKKPDPKPIPDTGSDVIEDVQNAEKERDALLKKLEIENKERLDRLTDDQRKEYENLKTAPIEAVVSWFDGLR